MKINVELDKGENGTSIEMANAIIRWHMDRAYDFGETEIALNNLDAIADHIRVYLSHYKK